MTAEMANCTFCKSGTFDPILRFVEKVYYVIYCRKCWTDQGGDYDTQN